MAIKHCFYTIGGATKTRALTFKSAIREHCIHCMQSVQGPRECTSIKCPLYPFRNGSEGKSGMPRVEKRTGQPIRPLLLGE